MGNTLPKLHQVNSIAYNSGPNVIHGKTITSFDAYHKAIKWFLHHMNGLILFKRYVWNLDALELSILITFLLLITIGEVCVFKSKTLLLVCEQCDKVRTSFFFRQFTLSPLPIQGMFYRSSCDLIRGLCPWPWRTYPLHSIETPYGMHTHKVVVTNLR
jgi:hypothetical protein